MKKILTFLFSLLLLSALAQDTQKPKYNYTDENGLKQGEWRKGDENNKLRYIGQFKNNIPYGRFTYYYPSGNIKSFNDFYNEGKSARNVTFYDGGTKNAEGNFHHEKRDSTWRFYNIDGKLISEESYIMGIKNGKSVSYYPSGKVNQIMGFKEDKKHGEWKQFFEDEKVKLETTYKNGELDGAFKTYFPNGELSRSGNYSNAMKDGEWLQFLENGKVKMSETYSKGSMKIQKRMNGIFEETYPEGIPKYSYTYKDGKLDGPFVKYYNVGRFVKEMKQVVADGQAEEVETLVDQKKQQEGIYKNDKLHGKIIYYKESGKVLKTEEYNEGVLLK